jgi:hypothetical protein
MVMVEFYTNTTLFHYSIAVTISNCMLPYQKHVFSNVLLFHHDIAAYTIIIVTPTFVVLITKSQTVRHQFVL